jgi:RNA polymerase sigma-70 factor, ECF subfamily
VTDDRTRDAELVRRLAAGERDALRAIYDGHAGAVLGLGRQVLGDPERAQEVAQTVFLRLWEKPEAYDADRGALRTYLLTMTHGRCLDLLRSDGARRRREERDHQRGEPVRPAHTPEDWLAAVRHDVRAALMQLGDGERAAIVTAYYGGYTYQQAAQLLGVPEGTVKSRIRSGLRRLRDLVGDHPADVTGSTVPASPGVAQGGGP